MSAWRLGCVGILLAGLVLAPVFAAAVVGPGPLALIPGALTGLAAAVDDVGFVLVPQLLLAGAVLGFGLQRITTRLAGLRAPASPIWLDPAVESALLLGMLGTLAGMVSGFVGLSPEDLEPGPLVHSLGRALRSSFVGFGIALIGVWLQTRPDPCREATS